MKHQQTVHPMDSFKVAEIFESINGEGSKAGELALFIRFSWCNLKCSYCDTKWAMDKDSYTSIYEIEKLADIINTSSIGNITLTGGEPLLQKNLGSLLNMISEEKEIEIETNGSISIKDLKNLKNPPSITMDYKLPGSLMEDTMFVENLNYLDKHDSLKFVVGSNEDLNRANSIINKHYLNTRTRVFFSPVFGLIEPKEIVDYMKINRLNGVRLQLQLHKYIWDPQQQGV